MENMEASLWSRWQRRRDETAFEELVRPHLRFLRGFARRLGCSAADADDVVQNTLVRLADDRTLKPATVGLRAWLGRTLLSEVRMFFRARGRRQRRERQARIRPQLGTEAVDHRDEVEAALGALRETERRAIVLRFLHDLDYGEVAYILGITRRAARMRVRRGVTRLRKRLGNNALASLAALPLLGGNAAARQLLARGVVRSTAVETGAASFSKLGGALMTMTTKVCLGGCAAFVAGLILWPAGERPDSTVKRAERSSGDASHVRPDLSGPPSTRAMRGGAVTPCSDAGCGWFLPWRNKEPTPELCKAVVAAMRPLSSSRAACLSDRWLVAVLQSHCARAVVLTPDELTMLVNAVGGDVEKALLSSSLTDTSAGLDLLVAELLARRPEIMSSSSWAAYCSRLAGKVQGGIQVADPRMIAIAKTLLESRSADDAQWWRQFWGGLPEDGTALHARKAVFEAIAQDSDRLLQERAFRMFAGFEDTRSVNANFGLVALGMTLQSVSFLKSEALNAIMSESEANWRRAMLWSLDPSAKWPRRRGEIDIAVANAVIDVLRKQPTEADEKFFRGDLLSQVWAVLGPRLAAEEFREFTVSRVQDRREAASRVAIAVYEIASNRDSKLPGDQEAFDAAEAHLSALFASKRYPLNDLMELVLGNFKANKRSARDILVRALGSQLRTLRKDLYKRLVK